MDEQQARPAPTPTVGRAVHLRQYLDGQAGECLHATVARVWSPTTINVGALDQDGRAFSATSVVEDVPPGRTITGYRWHWPERV